MELKLGKIISAEYGFGGYQDAQFGLSLDLSGDGWGVSDFWGQWARRGKGAKWSEEDWEWGVFVDWRRVVDLLEIAKKRHVSQLTGLPVEVQFDDGLKLKHWRILKEVL